MALVARDGSIDWLCLPDLDSPSVFAAVLDAERGGRFELQPEIPAEMKRRYRPDTNVLETTFTTGQGVVRVTDALALPSSELGPTRELIRRVDGVAGRVPMRWNITPAFGYATIPPRLERRGGIPVAMAGSDALAVCSWDAGEAQLDGRAVFGRFEARESRSAVIALCAAHQEPLVFPSRQHVEARLDATTSYWRGWAAQRTYDGPWRDAVIRSALALKLLFHAPSGAIAAAATTSLPEEIGGERNWDYRFCWVRDSAFTLDALLQLGCPREAEAFFWWLLHASQLTHPRLQVLYRLNGGERAPERTLELDGYRGSRPVRVGNAAAAQTQLDIYGDLLQTALVYAQAGGRIDRDTGRRLAGIADLVCRVWRQPDAGIWEVRSEPGHFTHSKMMCWVALDRALRSGRRRPRPRQARVEVAEGRARDPRVHRNALLVRATRLVTRARPTARSSTPACCWGSCSVTTPPTPAGSPQRSTRSGASSGEARCSCATAETTGSAAAREPFCAARSGSPTRSPGSDASTKRPL